MAATMTLLLASLAACGQHLDQGPVLITTTMPAPSSPTDSPEPDACPADGLRYTAGAVEAALGHRAFVVTLLNCGTGTRQVAGYPDVQVLDATGRPLDVRIDHSTSYMAIDPGPGSFALAPGKTLLTVLSWSATVTDGDAQTGAAVTIAAAGEEPRRLAARTDLGTTAELSVTAWNPGLVQ